MEELPLDRLDPNPFQPRQTVAKGALDELAASIRATGILQPIVVRPRGERYEILVGERRWRAAGQAGLDRVPALVRHASDAEALELALVENLLREDLNPLEEAQAFQRLLAQFGWTQEELARRIGKDRSSVANALRLLRLPAPIQEDLRQGRLSMGHARAVLGLDTAEAQLRLRERILRGSWSVRAAEADVQTQTPRRRRPRRRAEEIEVLEEELRQALGTRVRVLGTLRKGHIVIYYSSDDDLERVHGLLTARPGGASRGGAV